MAPENGEKTEVIDGLREYELVFIVSPEVSDEQLQATVDNISRLITSSGGTVSGIERWGKRRLAYPIKHFVEGNYVLAKFRAKPEADKPLESNLRITESILRHLVVRVGE